ncbi:DUF1353 domain-containing protein [Pseudooceanicola sp.]|uniref:DUF1353 domain-containing protein n=1 Tax=Pseudooceanicola sp. TaxID=1914328 RepID=UPI0026155665|nr:DUF1353 domain-containing protein [Pseudooceanicola sp.]MDF1854519.1 DUF1353 domain-containing protein [Pseudooceanicola sp.]
MRILTLVAALAAISGCTGDLTQVPDAAKGRDFCADPASPTCRFLNAPVKLSPKKVSLPGRPYAFHPTREALEFVDGMGRHWRAPVGTLTDGASIPVVFAQIIGNPTSREFVNAAAMHDAICGIGNTELPGFHDATWEATHRMFYDGLRVGGTDEIRSKLMFAAVYLGGPRWLPGDKTFDMRQDRSAEAIVSTQGTRVAAVTRGLRGQALGRVSTAELQAMMRRVKVWIETNNPGVGQIESYIQRQEQQALAALAAEQAGGDGPSHPAEPQAEAPDPGPVTTPIGESAEIANPAVADPTAGTETGSGL